MKIDPGPTSEHIVRHVDESGNSQLVLARQQKDRQRIWSVDDHAAPVSGYTSSFLPAGT
jgi:hypothetical protein